MKMKGIFDDANNMLHGVVGFGMSLVVALLVAELLFPGYKYSIVDNVTGMISTFIDKGLVGLIALLVFIAVFNRK